MRPLMKRRARYAQAPCSLALRYFAVLPFTTCFLVAFRLREQWPAEPHSSCPCRCQPFHRSLMVHTALHVRNVGKDLDNENTGSRYSLIVEESLISLSFDSLARKFFKRSRKIKRTVVQAKCSHDRSLYYESPRSQAECADRLANFP